jgi:hypothetical protein
LEASELSNQASMLARLVRARLPKALDAQTLERRNTLCGVSMNEQRIIEQWMATVAS